MLLVFPLVVFFANRNAVISIVMIAFLTDVLDGWIARKKNARTPTGTWLDPLADKVLIGAGFICLARSGCMAWWITGIIIARDFLLISCWLVFGWLGRFVEVIPDWLGKISMFCQLAVLVLVILGHTVNWMIYLMVCLTVVSGLNYLVHGISRLAKRTEPIMVGK